MSTRRNLKKLTIYFLFLLISSCSNSGSSLNISDSNQNNSGCSEKPTATLTKNNVKEISLQEQIITESGQVSVNKNIGYTFQAKQGQKLNFKTDDDICIWVFTPDNSILPSTELPKAGTYIIQVAALKGFTTFDLDLSFGSLKSSPPSFTELNGERARSSTPVLINIDVFYTRGSSLVQKEEQNKLINNYQKAIQNNPQNINAYINKGIAYYRLGKYERERGQKVEST